MAYTSDPEFTYDHNSGSADSIREDLLDEISIASPVRVPLLSVIPRGPDAGASYIEWLADEIVPPNQTNTNKLFAQVEGADADFTQATEPRQRLANYTHIVARYVDVSSSLRAVVTAGIEDEYAYKIWKKMLEAAQQIDYVLTWSDSDAGSSSTARRMSGVMEVLYVTGKQDANVTFNGQTVNTTKYGATWFQKTAGGSMTRDQFNTNILQPAHIAGMTIDGSYAFCGVVTKRVISQFALVYDGGTNTIPLNHRHIEAEQYTAVDRIDVLETDMGRLYFNLSRQMDYTSGDPTYQSGTLTAEVVDIDESLMILELPYWRLRTLRGLSYSPLAKIGDADKGMVVWEGSLEYANPICGAGGTNLVN